MLLLSIWVGKRAGMTLDPNKSMEDVHKAMRLLEAVEDKFVIDLFWSLQPLINFASRLHVAGRLW